MCVINVGNAKGANIMRENIYAVLLFVIELIIFYISCTILDISNQLALKIGILWFGLIFIFKHYKIESTLVWDEIRNDTKTFLAFCFLILVIDYPKISFYFRIVLLGFIMLVISIILNRMLRIVLRKYLARRTLIVGTGNDAYRVASISHNNRFALTEVVGFIKVKNEIQALELINHEKFRVYNFENLDNILKEEKIDQVIIAIPQATRRQIDEVSKKLFGKVQIIKVLPELNFTMTFNSKINDFDGELLISTSQGKLGFVENIIKRLVDICAGLAGCLLLIPLTLYVSHKNKKNGDTDPIFFKQERIGLHGKPIYIYKYRSMVPNAEEVLDELMKNDPAIREEYLKNKKIVNDPRITEVGNFLRKTSLDEFPQFWNVLKGDMSLVGPRPYLPREKEDMDIYYDSVIECKPGITGMWQANGRSDVGFEDRCKLDDYYYRNWSLGLDLIIIYKTVKSVFYGKGAL